MRAGFCRIPHRRVRAIEAASELESTLPPEEDKAHTSESTSGTTFEATHSTRSSCSGYSLQFLDTTRSPRPNSKRVSTPPTPGYPGGTFLPSTSVLTISSTGLCVLGSEVMRNRKMKKLHNIGEHGRSKPQQDNDRGMI